MIWLIFGAEKHQAIDPDESLQNNKAVHGNQEHWALRERLLIFITDIVPVEPVTHNNIVHGSCDEYQPST